ncbi:ABC transporter permease [Candidatus Bipolaricaulota bacterium]|jgi:peptide/nickel transport system permease protein|nr:ABC transporter permease [Candidatus Bipolaricaulota bacterium]MCK4682304.1 ABC transporter permease [Candidatus Bipolaricaulota bacterium]
MKILKVIRSQTRKNPLMVAGLVVCILWFAVSLVPNLVAPYGPLEQNIRERLQPPSASHLFGTDQLGRDVLSRVLYGGRISLPAGLLVVVSAAIVGTAMGSVAGYIGGAWDETLMRITEVFMSFPIIILAMAITAALGPSTINAVLAMVVVWWPNYARIVRSLVLSVKANEYVQASRAIGASRAYILFRTILPNCVAPAVVMATLDIGNAILIFASLSFLGLGPEPSAAEWGRMVADGIDYFDQWWLSAFPGIAIFTVILSFNLVGDGLRDLLDPRMRKALTR